MCKLKRLGQKCFSLKKPNSVNSKIQISSGFLLDLLKCVCEVFSFFQRLIGVQDEDSCGKSSLCETCPALGLRGTCHKSTRPRRQKTPSWPIRLMSPASEQSPSAFLPAGANATRRLTGYPRKAKSCTEINSGKKSPH
jgi:hypothetical protein